MSTNDIRVQISLKDHRKLKRLIRVIGIGALHHLVMLWLATAEQCPDGHLKGWDEQDIADAAQWTENPKMLIDALCSPDCPWLDRNGDGFHIHDWATNQPWVVGAPRRSETARHNALSRWHSDHNADGIPLPCDLHTTGNPQSNADCNAPSPSPSPSPIPTLPSNVCPYQDIVMIWKESVPSLPKPDSHIDPSSSRGKAIKTRWAQNPDLAVFREMFKRVEASDFLKGDNPHHWRASLDWVLKAMNWQKIKEGNYDNKVKGALHDRVPTQYTRPEDLP